MEGIELQNTEDVPPPSGSTPLGGVYAVSKEEKKALKESFITSFARSHGMHRLRRLWNVYRMVKGKLELRLEVHYSVIVLLFYFSFLPFQFSANPWLVLIPVVCSLIFGAFLLYRRMPLREWLKKGNVAHFVPRWFSACLMFTMVCMLVVYVWAGTILHDAGISFNRTESGIDQDDPRWDRYDLLLAGQAVVTHLTALTLLIITVTGGWGMSEDGKEHMDAERARLHNDSPGAATIVGEVERAAKEFYIGSKGQVSMAWYQQVVVFLLAAGLPLMQLVPRIMQEFTEVGYTPLADSEATHFVIFAVATIGTTMILVVFAHYANSVIALFDENSLIMWQMGLRAEQVNSVEEARSWHMARLFMQNTSMYFNMARVSTAAGLLAMVVIVCVAIEVSIVFTRDPIELVQSFSLTLMYISAMVGMYVNWMVIKALSINEAQKDHVRILKSIELRDAYQHKEENKDLYDALGHIIAEIEEYDEPVRIMGVVITPGMLTAFRSYLGAAVAALLSRITLE